MIKLQEYLVWIYYYREVIKNKKQIKVSVEVCNYRRVRRYDVNTAVGNLLHGCLFYILILSPIVILYVFLRRGRKNPYSPVPSFELVKMQWLPYCFRMRCHVNDGQTNRRSSSHEI